MRQKIVFLIFGLLISAPLLFSETAVIDVGNKVCPLSGDEVKGKDFVEYQGKRYGICCAMCAKNFLKNPEKYIKSLESK